MTVRRVEQGYFPFLSTQGKFARDLDVQVGDLFEARRAQRRKRTAVAA